MEEIWEWENLKEAMWRVKTNKGSAGIAKAVGPELGVRGNRDPSVGISTFPLFILFGSRATNIHSAGNFALELFWREPAQVDGFIQIVIPRNNDG